MKMKLIFLALRLLSKNPRPASEARAFLDASIEIQKIYNGSPALRAGCRGILDKANETP